MNRRAMILAAGRGMRLRPLTDKIPKPLLQVAGETLVGRQLQALSSANVGEVVINTAWLGWMIRAYIGDGSRFGLTVSYSDEGDQALETGGGIYKALPLLGEEAFFLINADIWTEMLPDEIVVPGEKDLAHLVLVPNPPHNLKGDFLLDGDRVRNPDADVATTKSLTYSGIAMLRPELFVKCVAGRFPLAPLLRSAIQENRVSGQCYDGVWIDTGAPDRLEHARAWARRRR